MYIDNIKINKWKSKNNFKKCAITQVKKNIDSINRLGKQIILKYFTIVNTMTILLGRYVWVYFVSQEIIHRNFRS